MRQLLPNKSGLSNKRRNTFAIQPGKKIGLLVLSYNVFLYPNFQHARFNSTSALTMRKNGRWKNKGGEHASDATLRSRARRRPTRLRARVVHQHLRRYAPREPSARGH